MPSGVIRDWAYDAASASLAITFVNGRRYRYADVPAEVAEEMRLAFAKGAFFNRRIRGRYRASPLQPGTREPERDPATAARQYPLKQGRMP